jgi:outer membrane protein TolC
MPPSNLRILAIALLSVTLSGSVLAENRRFDLGQAIDAALTENPKIALAAAKVATKEWELQVANKGMSPKVSLDAKTQFGTGDSTSFFALQGPGDPDENAVTSNGPYASASLSLALPLYENGSWRTEETAQQAQAVARVDKSKFESTVDSLALANEVFKDYLGVLEIQETIPRYQSVIENKRKTLGLIKKKIAAQIAVASDAYRLEADLVAARSELKAAERKRDRILNQLRLTLGLPRGDTVELMPLPDLPEVSSDIDSMVVEALANNPDLQVKESEIRLSNAQLREVQNEHSPTVALNAAMNTANDLQGSSIHAFYSVGVSLNMPLYDSGKNSAEASAKASMLMEAKQSLLLAQNELTAKVQDAHDSWLNALDDVQSARVDMEQTLLQELATRKLLQAGSSTLDRLSAQEGEVLSKSIKLIQVRYKAWNAYAELLKTTGKTKPSFLSARAGS